MVKLGLLIVGASAILVLVLAVPAALGAREDLNAGRTAMLAGRDAFAAGDPEGAARAFAEAESAFTEAKDQAGNLGLRVLGLLPVAGRSPDAVEAMAEAGVSAASAGRALVGAVEDIPGGLTALAPRNGRFPVDRLEEAAPALGEARALLDEAVATMSEAPDSLLLPPVAEARGQVARELEEARRVLVAADEIAAHLPSFLGADGPRTYFVGAQNPAELRGTGGFVGAYAILTADHGRLDLGSFEDIGSLPAVDPSNIEPPNPDYAARFNRYGGAGFWHNINMTRDAPSAASAIEGLYERVMGVSLDGVILADPQALSLLLGATGPQPVPGLDVEVSANTVVPFVTNEAYAKFSDSAARKRLLGDVAGAALDEFLAGDAGVDPVAAGRALIDAAAGGHLLFHAADPGTQEAFESANMAGALGGSGGDLISVAMNNAGGNKVDFYARRTVDYRARLQPGGTVDAAASVVVDNEAPDRGQPAYVIGPYDDVSEAGESVLITSVYCAPGCELDAFRRDGRDTGAAIEEELGHPVFSVESAIPSGGSERLDLEWTLEDGWEDRAGGGTYRLTVQGQPTIDPTIVHVEIRAPAGTSIARTTPQMEVDGAVARWEGDAGDATTFEVEVERPFPGSLWHALWASLNDSAVEVLTAG